MQAILTTLKRLTNLSRHLRPTRRPATPSTCLGLDALEDRLVPSTTPAALLTMRKHSRRQSSQGSVGWADVFADFLGAIAATIGVLILLIVVLFIALAAFCFVMMSSTSFR